MHGAIGRRVLGAAAIGALAGALFVSPAGAKGLAAVAGTGTVACHAAGKVTFNPPLATGGTATTETVTLKANLVNCTGTGGGATIKSGKATATATLATNDCSAPASITSGSLSSSVAWKTVMHSAPLTDSTVAFTSGSVGTSTTGKPTLSLAGSTTAGSFTGDAASVSVTVSKSLNALGLACANGRLGSLTFNASATTASLG